MFKPLVYVAGPYTKGDPCMNTYAQLLTFDQMLNDGYATPIIPLWSHFQHTAFPRPYRDWIEYDKAIIPRVDALLRLPADVRIPNTRSDAAQDVFGGNGHNAGTIYFQQESSGADGEEALAKSLSIPVFYSLHDLYRWIKEKTESMIDAANVPL